MGSQAICLDGVRVVLVMLVLLPLTQLSDAKSDC